ncbi:MAG: sugar phosphate isomerase/epimerase family protein [Deltaproteobacteria bacterium]|nr:sugar phosphate isomerase/epimerase family protein [Deltaproteobacteria bacterium]
MHTKDPTLHVNIPFSMLYESYLDRFIHYGLNPEIGFDADALDRYAVSEIQPVAEKLQHSGLTVTLHGPFMDLSPGSPDPEIRSIARHRFEQLLKIVPIFKPRTVVCHTGYDHRRYWPMWDTWIENSRLIWTWLAGHVRDAGAILVLENVYEETPRELEELLSSLTEQGVGFCLDTGHQAVFSSTPINKWVETLGSFLTQLHLHDNTGKQDDHLALGTGTIDFKMLFRQLKSLQKPPCIITLEPHREAALWPSLSYIEALWPW